MAGSTSKFVGWLTVNRACNLRCGWCYGKECGFLEDEMSLDIVKSAINIYAGLGTRNVMLIGGEPTIHPYFLDIVKLLRKAGINPLLVTNGLRFSNPDFARATVAAGIHRVILSLKGAHDEQYKRLTGASVFSAVSEGFRNLASAGINATVSATMCGDTIANFGEVLEAAVKIGATKIAVNLERPVIIGNRTCASGNASPCELAATVMDIYSRLINCGARATIKISLPFCLFPREFIEMLIREGTLVSGCQLLRGSGIIFDPKGRLLPCHHFCNSYLGQVNRDFATSDDYLSFRQRGDISEFYSKAGAAPHSACTTCEYWRLCGGGCRIYWLHWGANELIGGFKYKRKEVKV